jgi:hypothetical protein
MSQVYMPAGHLPVDGTKTFRFRGGDDGDDGKDRGGEANNLDGVVGDEQGEEFISGREEVGVSQELMRRRCDGRRSSDSSCGRFMGTRRTGVMTVSLSSSSVSSMTEVGLAAILRCWSWTLIAARSPAILNRI